ncbi:MAG TPA: protein kinase [Candidatus Acidoferrales bacterium]|nr:protein kinase [Candidatus Acidoferrales bacterium]
MMGGTTGHMIGQTLGHYRIVEQIGAGGMGVVYRAHDERLDRDVALKVLPLGALADESARRRFRKEALTLAKLSHPHIGVVHDFDTQDGADFLVMEYIPGNTLAERLAGGALPEKETIALGAQIASALEEAHDHGVVHRDLKPGNVMLTAKGQAKVLDFGLAKLLRHAGDANATMTRTEMESDAGTLPYMAPEQLLGNPADSRTDIHALGGVLYEMATGRRPFQERTAAALAGEILHKQPRKPRELNPQISAELEWVILKCLEKEPENRYQSAKELQVDLRRLGSSTSGAAAVTTASLSRARAPLRRRTLALYAGLSVAAIGAAFWAWKTLTNRTSTAPGKAARIEQITAFTDSATAPALSADGRMLAFIRGAGTFITSGQIYVKLLPNGEPVPLTRDATHKMSPAFSPDGARVAYTVLPDNQSWDTWTVPVLGGEARLWLPNASSVSWIGPHRLLFSEIKTGIHMAIVAADEGRTGARDIYVPEDTRGMAHHSYLSPDGKWVLLSEMDRSGWLPCRVVPYEGNSAGRVVGPAKGQCTEAAWAPDGSWMYFTSNASGSFQIWRQRFPGGAPEELTFGPTVAEGIAVSADGRSLITSMGMVQMSVWIHENGSERQISAEGNALLPAWGDGFPGSVFSPDGKKLYYLVESGVRAGFGSGELWVKDLVSNSNEVVLPGLNVTSFDISSDGQRVVFSAVGVDGKSRIWLARLDRRSSPEQLRPEEALGPVFGSDDEVYFRAVEGSVSYIHELKVSSGQARRLVSEPAINSPILSPDGQWIVSTTPLAGQDSPAIVKAYPKNGGAPITLCQRCSAKWTRDGRSLFLSFGAGNVMGEAKTFVIALPPGKTFPSLPPGGIKTEVDVQKLHGVRVIRPVINRGFIFPGVTSSVYAFDKKYVQRNLYRVVLP